MKKITMFHIRKNLVLIAIYCFIFLNQSSVNAQTAADYKNIKLANKAYTEGDFQMAAELYEKVVKQGYTSAELNYNLGNTYYRLKDYKRAVLYYERAKLLRPDADDIQINLEFAQKFVQDKIESLPKFILVRWGNAFVDWFSVSAWSIISISTFIILLGMIVLFLFSKRELFRKLSVYASFVLIFISVISFYCAYRQNERLTSHSTAIVFSPSVTVKSSPDNNGTDLFIIHEGLKVTIISESGKWNEIKLNDGKIGWLPNESIEKI